MAPKKDAKGKDVKGKDAKGKDAKGKDAKGKDAKGKDAKGKDVKGKDAKGKDVKGKDAKKKDVKGKDAKKKDAKGKGPKVPAGPSVLENDGAKNAGKMVCVLLTIASITLTILCDRAYHKSREVPDAMGKLRTSLGKYDKSLEEKNDDELLEAAEAMSQHVIDRRINITLLKRDIAY
ncbi:hypothetical protein lerEdw1_012379 [Lerista edwardsae]|nr:hypothetical protein lerEdw1_012379 [Lerista edwardsae]